MNIWQSYKQVLGCFVHFVSLLAVCWPGTQTERQQPTHEASSGLLRPRKVISGTRCHHDLPCQIQQRYEYFVARSDSHCIYLCIYLFNIREHRQ